MEDKLPILINNLMRTWVRFRHNLYGDESYLTHTLPVERKTIYLSKFITSIILVFMFFSSFTNKKQILPVYRK